MVFQAGIRVMDNSSVENCTVTNNQFLCIRINGGAMKPKVCAPLLCQHETSTVVMLWQKCGVLQKPP